MLTEIEIAELRRVINRVWQEIGADIVASIPSSVDNEEYPTFTRYEIADICLDAWRWKGKGNDSIMEDVMEKLGNLGWNTPEWKAQIKLTLPEEYWSA
jgi:hypothetical protein